MLGRFLVHMSTRICVDDEHPYGLYAPSPPERADFWSTASIGEDSTLVFYLLLTASLSSYIPPRYSPWDYADAAGLLPGGHTLYWDREGDPEELRQRREDRHRRA